MTVALWDVAQVTEVGNAIREVRGETLSEETKVKVSEMPAKIREMVQGEERECWLEKIYERDKPEYNANLFIDTGIVPDHNDKLEYRCYGAESIIIIMGRTASACRNGAIIFPFSRKLQVCWGAGNYSGILLSSLTNGSDIYLNCAITVTQDKTGLKMVSSRDGKTVTYTNTFNAPSTPHTVTYKLFRNEQSTGTPYYGAFRYIKIFNGTTGDLKHELVPMVRNDWSVYILDKVTGRKITVPSGFRAQIDIA